MNEPTEYYLKKKFREYYEVLDLKNENYLDVTKREFAFTYFNRNGMDRPRYFKNVDELKEYILEHIPSAIFYSTAYYNIENMDKPEWERADLIFDLDADHLPNSDQMTYGEMLAKVKKEFVDLIECFILKDLSAEENEILITFSGNRGYHAHIHTARYQTIQSRERRIISSYIEMAKFSPSQILLLKENCVKRRLVDNLRHFGELKVIKNELKITDKELQKEIEKLRNISKDFELHDTLNTLKSKLEKRGSIEIYNYIVSTAIEQSRIHIDAPVTGDIRRLIRMPLSLHPKSGFVVKKITRTDLSKFDPLIDAIYEKFKDGIISVKGTEEGLKAHEFYINGNMFAIKKDQFNLPVYAAIFAACRGWVEVME